MIKLRKKPSGRLELVMNAYAFADSEAMMMVVKDELHSSFRLWLCSDSGCCAGGVERVASHVHVSML